MLQINKDFSLQASSLMDVTGIAIYSAKKPNPRYMVNIVHDMALGLYRFDYTMYCEPMSKKGIKKMLPDNFAELVHDRYRSPGLKNQADAHYRHMLQQIAPENKPRGFIQTEKPMRHTIEQDDDYVPVGNASTVSFYFDPARKYEIYNVFSTPTNASLTKTLTQTEASKAFFQSNDDNLLTLWHGFINAHSQHPVGFSQDESFIDFNAIHQSTALMVENAVSEYMLETNVEAVWRIDTKTKQDKKDSRDPVNFRSTGILRSNDQPVLHLTNPDYEAGAINRTLFGFYLNNRDNMLSSENIAAVATMCQDKKLPRSRYEMV